MSSHTSEEDTKNDVLRRTAGLEPVSSPEALSLDDRASTRRRKRKSRFVSLWPQDREEAQESLPRRQEQLFPMSVCAISSEARLVCRQRQHSASKYSVENPSGFNCLQGQRWAHVS